MKVIIHVAMHDPQLIAASLFGAWNVADRPARHRALKKVVASELIYSDPHQQEKSVGRDAYLALSDQLHELIPGFKLELGQVDGHHDVMRFGSRLFDTSGSLISIGQFFAVLDHNGRIAIMAAFGAPD